MEKNRAAMPEAPFQLFEKKTQVHTAINPIFQKIVPR